MTHPGWRGRNKCGVWISDAQQMKTRSAPDFFELAMAFVGILWSPVWNEGLWEVRVQLSSREMKGWSLHMVWQGTCYGYVGIETREKYMEYKANTSFFSHKWLIINYLSHNVWVVYTPGQKKRSGLKLQSINF